MARLSDPLDTGDIFPDLTVSVLGDEAAMELPRGLAGRWSVVLVYRAHW